MSEDSDKQDDLLRRAREIARDADAARREAADAQVSGLERFFRDNRFCRWCADFGRSIGRFLGPIGTFFGWLFRQVGRWLRWLAIRPADPDAPGGPQPARFSWPRTVLNLAISLLVLVAIQVTFRALYYYGTQFDETVYVTGKQEIETGEVYQFGGCTSLPCNTQFDNGKFYLIESSLYLPALWYPEEEVFANVPQQNGVCQVHGYGIYFRSMRWIYKTFQLYQHVTDVSCRPYTEEEIRKAVTDGSIARD
jgi:hypothetical protein